MSKIKLLLIFTSLFILTLAVYFVIKKNKTTVDDTQTVFNKLITPNPFVYRDEKCFLEDSVIFRSYKEAEPNEKEQKNIGYVNNKFGLYIYSVENFAKKADEMVNSNGGNWGYVLVPYNVKDYELNKWNSFFEILNRKHLIPIIQLWDVDIENYKKQTEKASEFLTKLPWPIKKKYISVYNEMNDSNFFNGGANPEIYSKILDFTISTFKKNDPDYFILNGAFNSTAPNVNGYVDQEVFMMKMNDEVPNIFKKLDGWASHSYPNPDYIGKPTDMGRGSIRNYEWELSVLKNKFNVSELPVFITETGWPHAEGETYNSKYYTDEKSASFLKQAFENVWLKDERVVAVTPFTIYYDSPHDHFSFVEKNGDTYRNFEVLKAMKKVSGKPPVLRESEKEFINCL